MEQLSFSVGKFKEFHDKGDVNGILSSLLELKKHLRGAKNVSDVDREMYEILISLIKHPNSKIMDITFSILANCCLKASHREMFKEFGGIPHLMVVLKTVDNDNILCRVCRLIGNLANDRSLASILNEYNAGFYLLKMLENISEKSSATVTMLFRAVKKLWAIEEYRSKMLSEEVLNDLIICLHSTDDQLATLSVETLALFSTLNSSQSKGAFKVSKELLARLVELSKKEELKDLTVSCLSNLICYQTSQVWKYLEGSKVPETFIDYLKGADHVNKVVLEAFYKLCTEGGVRNKVKTSGLLPRLMKFCSGRCTDKILLIFYLFQFDVSSIAILAQNKDFISLLTRNITKIGSVRLLSVVSRLDPPVKDFLSEENLNVIIQHKECHGILRKISQTKRFLSHLIVSGRIWEISKVNCLTEFQDHYVESLLVHLLRTGERNEIENAALAVPFLVKPRHFTLYNILAHNNGITIILRLLRERTLEERILATVVKLISIFQENIYNNYKHSRVFFDDALVRPEKLPPYRNELEDISMDEAKECGGGGSESFEENDDLRVTFKLDCNSFVTVNRSVLCKNSPVLDAMLNGHFIESSQKEVKLSCCTPEALLSLEKLLTNKAKISEINVETHLELISLTDRFLMLNLNDALAGSLVIDENSCVAVLKWCRNSGYTKNIGIIKKKAYEFVFSSSSYLLSAMKSDVLRVPLVDEISNYLCSSFVDLL